LKRKLIKGEKFGEKKGCGDESSGSGEGGGGGGRLVRGKVET